LSVYQKAFNSTVLVTVLLVQNTVSEGLSHSCTCTNVPEELVRELVLFGDMVGLMRYCISRAATILVHESY